MASRNKQTDIHPPKLQGGVAIGGVAVEAEFVDCYKYSVVDLQIIMCITRHVTLVCPIYSSLFAFHAQHSLEASCMQTLLVWTWRWGEYCFVYFGKPFMKVRVLWIRKQEVDVLLAKWIVGKRKQPRSGNLLLLSLLGQVIEGMREDTNRSVVEWLQLFRK